jgi:hypothetical protein
MAFARSAIILAERLPALPDGGDLAIDRTTVVDSRSGLAFETRHVSPVPKMQYEVSATWGVQMVKTEHAAVLLG